MTTAHAVQLRRGASGQREVAGWFLAGDEPAAWLEELSRWHVPLETLRCYLTPRGPGEFRAGGLLVLPATDGKKPADVRGLALGRIGGKLLVPVDAEVFPPATAAEIDALCRTPISLFHPALGLIEFENADACGVWNLLAPPVLTEADWNWARAGTTLDSRLTGVVLWALPAMADMFGEESEDIGSEPLGGLPPRPQEPSASAGSRISRRLRQWTARAVLKLFSSPPAKNSKAPAGTNNPKRTWVNDILDWATAKLGKVTEEMENLRQRELLRLMHLLESDPERGLRHALPLGGDPGRGQTPPSTQLGRRIVDFNLRNIGGGKPTDHWNVPWELRKKLTARYRELALHEKQLGKFKRAAYIYAELLGDLSAAAAVLKEGRYFAEAAVLYRDHLRQPLVAAECFVEGGLFAEALAIYEKESKWLELGDLHQRLGNLEAAQAAWRRLVEEKVASGDFIGAAGLLEERLQSPDEALALLRNGWPGTPQAVPCLAAEFSLLGRLGRHPVTLERLGALRAERTAPFRLIPLAQVLEGLCRDYPDNAVRQSAGDLARIKISPRLAGDDLMDLRAGVQIISRLAPADRLLARDASRFLAARTELLRARQPFSPAALPRKPGSRPIGAPQPSGTVGLPTGLIWTAVRRWGHGFLATAYRKEEPVLVRGNWLEHGNWLERFQLHELLGAWRSLRITALAADEASSQPDIVLPVPLAERRPPAWVILATSTFSKAFRFGHPDWVDPTTLAMSVSGAQWWVLRASENDLILEERTKAGNLVGSFYTAPADEWLGYTRENFFLLALRLHVWIAFGGTLLLFKGGRFERRWKLESPILGLEASAPFLPGAIVARCEFGAAVFWHDALADDVQMIATNLQRPRCVFLGNGALVLLSGISDGRGCEGLAVDLDRRGLYGERNFYKEGGAPIGLVSTDRPDEFAIFDGTSQARKMRLPSGP